MIVEGNRIKRIARGKWIFPGRRGSFEAGGKTVLPGLIDNHVHFDVVSVSGDMRGR
jgi:imidazolonepropionase-like amidohydrolase